MRRRLRGVLTIAITGTKGKTSVTEFVAQLLEAGGMVTAVSSNASARLASRAVGPCKTAPALYDFVMRCGQARVDCLVVELTSSLLSWDFQRGFDVDAAVLTNIGTDHIHEHGSRRNYVAVKARLFRNLGAAPDSPNPVAILNADDPHLAAFLTGLAPGVRSCAYGLRRPRTVPRVDRAVWASDIQHRRDGTSFTIHGVATRPLPCRTQLHGDFNVLNVLAAIACVVMVGRDPHVAVAAARSLAPPAGRFHIVAPPSARGPAVVVDYAHTPESVASALAAARALSPRGRVHAVFGSGGDTYKRKRPLMGAAAAAGADAITLTSDNPRSEDPFAIVRGILCGMPPQTRRSVRVELDRARAIREAIAAAGPHDIVAILGKGAERGQIVGDTTHPFSDVAVARAALVRAVRSRASAPARS